MNCGEFLVYEASLLCSVQSSILGEVKCVQGKFSYVVLWLFHQKALVGQKRDKTHLLVDSTLMMVQSYD